MSPVNILAGAGIIGAGAIMVVLGIRNNKKCSGRTFGRITGVREYRDIDSDGFSNISYAPEFEYEVNGQVYYGVGSTRYNRSSKIQIGAIVNVYYDPEKPNEYLTKGGRKDLQLVGIAVMVLGAIYTVISLKA